VEKRRSVVKRGRKLPNESDCYSPIRICSLLQLEYSSHGLYIYGLGVIMKMAGLKHYAEQTNLECVTIQHEGDQDGMYCQFSQIKSL
jgi:hypothetical protein